MLLPKMIRGQMLKMSSEDKKNMPLTEALVFDIVEYLLNNTGYGYSNEISFYIVDKKPKRYTSREVVGILRNRPMFKHAKVSERKGGIRWRLDVNSLERYLFQKGFEKKAETRGFYQMISRLKADQIGKSKLVLEREGDMDTDALYEALSKVWA